MDVTVRFVVSYQSYQFNLGHVPRTVGADPRCDINVTDPTMDQLVAVIWRAEFGIVILCVGRTYPVIAQPLGPDSHAEIIAPGTARLFHDNVSFNMAGLSGYILVTEQARKNFEECYPNIRRNLTLEPIDMEHPFRFRDSTFESLCNLRRLPESNLIQETDDPEYGEIER